MRTITLILFLTMAAQGFAQRANYSDSLITITGKVTDTTYSVGFYNLVVVNKTVGKGIFGEYDGSFKITVRKSDQIGISVVGYQTVYVSFKDSTYRSSYNVNVYIESLEYTSSEAVIVRPLKTLEQLREERLAIAKREVPEVTITSAISSPITALYVAFSKREKTKRKVADMEYQDQQDDIVKEILRVYVHAQIIDLSPDEFEQFITFLNLNTEFLKMASDYELISYIQEKFEHFQKINEGF